MVTIDFLKGCQKIALDTNFFIYVFEQHPEYGMNAKKILEYIESGIVQAVASSITLTEILVKPIRERNHKLEKQYKLLFCHFPNLTIIPITNVIAEQAAHLRGRYNIKTPDALIIATSMLSKK
jgi:predicted nucleic acid-binding protein